MNRVPDRFVALALTLLLSAIVNVQLQPNDDRYKGCAYMHCDREETCVQRKFRCGNPPCPSMMYCAKSRKESVRGPPTCDSVRCSRDHICIVKARLCGWDSMCQQQVARCVTRKEYHEGPATCVGFKCPPGYHCILRESFCVNPPCKLLRSCGRNKGVQAWLGRCRSLGCPSEYDCFLRRPDANCSDLFCRHTPDCLTTKEAEITSTHCRGWVCPRNEKCSARIVGPCNGESCDVERSCDKTRELAGTLPSINVHDGILSSESEREVTRRNETKDSETIKWRRDEINLPDLFGSARETLDEPGKNYALDLNNSEGPSIRGNESSFDQSYPISTEKEKIEVTPRTYLLPPYAPLGQTDDPFYKELKIYPSYSLPHVANIHGRSYYLLPIEPEQLPHATDQTTAKSYEPKNSVKSDELTSDQRNEAKAVQRERNVARPISGGESDQSKVIDLNSLLELSKDEVLTYIRGFLEALDEDQPAEMEPGPVHRTINDEPEFLKSFHPSRPGVREESEQNRTPEKNPRTAWLIYDDPPSYGAYGNISEDYYNGEGKNIG